MVIGCLFLLYAKFSHKPIYLEKQNDNSYVKYEQVLRRFQNILTTSRQTVVSLVNNVHELRFLLELVTFFDYFCASSNNTTTVSRAEIRPSGFPVYRRFPTRHSGRRSNCISLKHVRDRIQRENTQTRYRRP